ncbi:hypothetical protein Asulf_01422 [Archaeoglobus sulfaticallidus PM70-1]|uniref:HTH arsR-type domain-containing protein n=1 Tax=Archaeoglobus sulfaticallidus PM70-1 TaxID=387631 RepID=N0BCR8_9EURY|nr:winged helix-turn-helix domain-containing protein [Archaeoglobus sulfaticallidus]AGK61409.1 hypothetical protein Asulf_01422 [Archaeoglobus sulfaticallidus PM70-1]
MNNTEIELRKEILEIKREIEKLRRLITGDFLKIFENYLEAKLGEILISIISAQNKELLSERLQKGCSRFEVCMTNFSKFLDEALRDGMDLKELEALYEEKKGMVSQLENRAPYEKCSCCFSEVLKLLKKQHQVLKLFKNTIRASFQTGIEYEKIDANEIMRRIEPLSNEIRIKILLELFKCPKRFSQLSNITGLDGGNLRFHIKKLVDAGLVVQHKKGGEYIITEQGRVFLERLVNVLYSV